CDTASAENGVAGRSHAAARRARVIQRVGRMTRYSTAGVGPGVHRLARHGRRMLAPLVVGWDPLSVGAWTARRPRRGRAIVIAIVGHAYFSAILDSTRATPSCF